MKITDIKTNSVYIRTIVKEDMPDLIEYLSDEETMKFFDHGALNEQAILLLIEKKNVIYGICDILTNKLIGHFVYHQWFMVDTYEIGWVLNKKYHNQGIMTALAKEFIDYAFEIDKAHRIVATCQPENIPSKRICEKTGMRLEGLFQKCIYVARVDQWWDELFYAMLAEEYIKGGIKDVKD